MTQPILIVEDDPLQRKMLAIFLRKKLNFNSCEAENGRAALDILDNNQLKTIKLAIIDLDMPVMDGMETLEIIRQKYPSLPVIILTGTTNIDDAVKAMKLGAVDFLAKPYKGERIAVTVKNALKISTLSKEVLRLKNEKQGTYRFKNLIGYDNGLLSTVHIGHKYASSDIPVLITGETGTGKEVFARAIHGESSRNGRAFIAVNCGAIPSQLVESTLFGHEKGAFTGATEKVIGKFREANGGTIFLDEIGELPLDAQVKLLRTLQQKEVEPVGAGKPVPINARIISATNKNLEESIKENKFREDLFFRLNVLKINLPPLRDRKQDILELAIHFVERFCASEGIMPKDISEDAEQKLMDFKWPGNVRQLENAINRAMVLSDGNILYADDFNALFSGIDHKEISLSPQLSKPYNISSITDNGDFKTINEIEQEAIQLALMHYNNNMTQTAKALNMAKSTLYKKIKIYNQSIVA